MFADVVDSILYKTAQDGFLYLIPDLRKKWEESKAFCEKIPGHRLGMFHSIVQLQSLVSLQEESGKFS